MSLLGTLAFMMTSQFCTCTLNSQILSLLDSLPLSEGLMVQDPNSYAPAASGFLLDVNNELRQQKHGLAQAEWIYSTNMTDYNMRQLVRVRAEFSRWYLTQVRSARGYNISVMPPDIQRQLKMFTVSATSSNQTLSQETSQLQTSMIGRYSSARACLTNGTCLPLERSLKSIMASSRDPQTLTEVWTKWRQASGRPLRSLYTRLAQLLNSSAVENGYTDYSVYEQQSTFFETPELEMMQSHLWQAIRPLYLELHAYVRRKLRLVYGSDVIGQDGTIPAHLLGDMWAQHWTHILDLVKPFPEVDDERRVDNRLKARASVRDMFQLAENFFQSLGMTGLPHRFWRESVLVKPLDRQIVCHASSMDMFWRQDFRIKMCAKVGLSDFRTVHHEMGHVMYFMAYANQPAIFRTGANDAFHEAVGDTIQLSALSSSHLSRLGLLEVEEEEEEEQGQGDEEMEAYREEGAGQTLTGAGYDSAAAAASAAAGLMSSSSSSSSRSTRTLSATEKRTINSLFTTALEKVAFHPFGYLLDKWRNEVMRGQITSGQYNRKWWELRLHHQGIRAPVPRSENDFDPGSKFHVIANVPYASYFVSYVLQFQLYEALCAARGFHASRPLHECDFYGSAEAGRKLRSLLSNGSSIPWQVQLQRMTGHATVRAQPLLRYFAPLHQWLARENRRHGEQPGWEGATINWRHAS